MKEKERILSEKIENAMNESYEAFYKQSSQHTLDLLNQKVSILCEVYFELFEKRYISIDEQKQNEIESCDEIIKYN